MGIEVGRGSELSEHFFEVLSSVNNWNLLPMFVVSLLIVLVRCLVFLYLTRVFCVFDLMTTGLIYPNARWISKRVCHALSRVAQLWAELNTV